MRASISLMIAALAGTAHADDTMLKDRFTWGFQLTATDVVREAWGYELPSGGSYTHVVFGRYTDDRPELLRTGVVLMACDAKRCTGKAVDLGDKPVELLGVVDLMGAPGPFPTAAVERGRGRFHKLDTKTPPKRPALVLRQSEVKANQTSESRYGGKVTGTTVHDELHVLLLAPNDKPAGANPKIFSHDATHRGPTGAGQTTSFRLDRGSPGEPLLDIIATTQQHNESRSACLPPPPVDVRWRWQVWRYEYVTTPVVRGC